MTREYGPGDAEERRSMEALVQCAAKRSAKLTAELAAGRDPRGQPLPPQPHWHVAEYVHRIESGRDDFERYRVLISDLPRRFHQSSPDWQESALRKPLGLTHTKWDALLAATAEHIAITHEHPVPPWCDDPQRFLDIIWVPLPVFGGFRIWDYVETPAAFLRRGVIIGGREFGEREGKREYGALFRR